MDVKSVMTADPAHCTRDTPLQQVARMMVEFDCGAIPVLDSHNGRNPIGVVTDRDIAVRLVAQGINPLDSRAGDCMTSPISTLTADSSLSDCCRLMESEQIRRVVVVDAHGRLCGMVALADVALVADERKAGAVVKEISEPASAAICAVPIVA